MTTDRKPTIPEVLPLIRAYYAKDDNSAGGSLHIVLEDGNIHDVYLLYAQQWAQERGDEDGERLVLLLMRMSRTQRSKLASMSHYFWL